MEKIKTVDAVTTDIPLFEPRLGGKEWEYVKECLDTGWLSSAGEYVERFERSVADYIQCRYAVACVNGTAALHTALLVAGIKSEDEVIIPALTFVATGNAVRYTGACPVFVDVDCDIWQIDIQKVKDFLNKECYQNNGRLINRRTKRIVRAIIPVHLLGHPADMDPILELAKRFGLMVIEDAAAAIGAKYKNRFVGHLGDIGCFSFNGNKIITSGGGGMLMTNNQQWADQARYLITQAKDDALEHIHHNIGYNYRLTNIQAAVGVAQLQQLENFIKIKQHIFEQYNKLFQDIPEIILPKVMPWAQPNYWLYTILIDSQRYGISSRELLNFLKKSHIQTRPLWHPLHTLIPFQDCYAYYVEVAEELYRKALSLPSSVGLDEENLRRVAQAIIECRRV